MTAKTYLEQIKKLDALIDNKLSEKESIYDMLTRITPNLSDMPHGSGSSDKIGIGVAKLVDLENEINALIDKYVDTKKEVQSVIEQLPANQYNVLYKHYFKYETYDLIAEEMFYTRRNVEILAKKGLDEVFRIISHNTII